MTKKKDFRDPRARRLIASAYVALGTTPVVVCWLGSYLTGGRLAGDGGLDSSGWFAVSLIAILAGAALVCLIVAPRLEAEAHRIRVAHQRPAITLLAARSTAPPADPTPVVVSTPTGPVLPPPVTVAPTPVVEPASASVPAQPDPISQPAPAQAQ